MNEITIGIDDPSRPEVTALLQQLDDFLTSLYEPEHNHLMPVTALLEPRVTFITARCGDRPVGCGAIVDHNGDYAEVKRMFVVPEFRGRGIARRILTELECLARRAGFGRMRLETGAMQEQAIGLYRSVGFRPREQFGDYPNIPFLSVFLEKQIA